jgi:hypothetical protein
VLRWHFEPLLIESKAVGDLGQKMAWYEQSVTDGMDLVKTKLKAAQICPYFKNH